MPSPSYLLGVYEPKFLIVSIDRPAIMLLNVGGEMTLASSLSRLLPFFTVVLCIRLIADEDGGSLVNPSSRFQIGEFVDLLYIFVFLCVFLFIATSLIKDVLVYFFSLLVIVFFIYKNAESGIIQSYKLFSNTEYIGMQSDASLFLDYIHGSTAYYNIDELDYFRILTDRPFLRATELKALGADSNDFVITEENMKELIALDSIHFWYGGYHFEMKLADDQIGTKKYYFVLPPGDFHNLALIIPDRIYNKL